MTVRQRLASSRQTPVWSLSLWVSPALLTTTESEGVILLSRSGVHFVPMAALFSGEDYHSPRRFVLVSKYFYLSYYEGRNMIAGFENDRHNVTIHDARNSPGTFHETGFTLIKLDQVLT